MTTLETTVLEKIAQGLGLRAEIANAIFDPSFPDADSLRQLEATDVAVVILPRQWAWFDDAAVGHWIDAHGLELLERNRDALAIAIAG